MTPLLCALNPGHPLTVVQNARSGGREWNIPYTSQGTVRRVRWSAQWGWYVEIRGENPLWMVAVPLGKITGSLVDLYREHRYQPLAPVGKVS